MGVRERATKTNGAVPLSPAAVPVARVSVIIPVFNDDQRLRLCLDALSHQTYPRNCFEIIVVDNGSSNPPVWVRNQFSRVVLAEESQPGSYAARNRGITLAKGDVLAFTDSDCVPRPEWIENGVRELTSDTNVGLVGGRVEFMFRDPDRPGIAELYDSISYLQQRNAVELTKFAATANMFTRRAVLDQVGHFDVAVKSGGDRDWGQRVAAAGYELRYAAEAVVGHPARSSFREIRKKNVRVIGGHHQWRADVNDGRRLGELAKELAEDLSPPVRFIGRIVHDHRVKGPKNKTLVTAMHWFSKLLNAWTRIKLYFGAPPTRS